jgi:hypothetical protein
MKCEPEKSAQLMKYYEGITFGYHSDKKHWISVYIQSDVPDRLIEKLIGHSVEEVIKKLPKKNRKHINRNNFLKNRGFILMRRSLQAVTEALPNFFIFKRN